VVQSSFKSSINSKHMQRRNFIKACGITTGALVSPSIIKAESLSKPQDDTLLQKVKTAMLGMQRYSWEQGVASHALIDMNDEAGAIAMALGAIQRVLPDGRLGRMGQGHSVTDPMSCGEAVLYAYEKTGAEEFKTAFDKMVAYAKDSAPRTSSGVIHHFDNNPWVWVDSMYMAPPFLAKANLFQDAVHQLKGMHDLLWDKDTGLYFHQYDDSIKSFRKKVLWSTGNGWAAAGLARTLSFLPSYLKKEKQELQQMLLNLIEAALKYQTPSGFFRDVLDDENTYEETCGTSLFGYAIYTAIANGNLPQKYKSAADKMSTAVKTKIDEWGFVRASSKFDPRNNTGTTTESQAAFLMMETAKRRKPEIGDWKPE